jgi:ribonucleoside-diphosphate reductase alpha chain
MYKINDVAMNLLKQDYLLDGETPEQMFMRVAKTIAQAEKEEDREYWTKRFYDTMIEGYWIPATPFLMNAGRNNMFSSCFVIGQIEDDLNSIFDVNKRAANVTKMGGGIGLNVSRLREEGAPIGSTGGKSSGPVSFMKIFNTTLDVVMQARRRGAGIIVMDVYHADIKKFITCKQDHKDITNFNLSVLVDDNFMDAVVNDRDIDLRSPLGYVTETVKARNIFKMITDNAYRHAEPGIIFKDVINRDNPTLDVLGPIDSVNACVTGETMVLTDKGYVPIAQLAGKTTNVWNGYEFSTVVPQITGYNKQIYCIYFDNGKILRCTDYHKFYIQDGCNTVCKQARELAVRDMIAPFALPDGQVCDDISIIDIKIEPDLCDVVYCFNEPKRHRGCFNGVVTGNCSEIPLYNNEACNLSAINWEMFIKNKRFDTDKLDYIVETIVRFLDDAIEVNNYPDNIIKEAVLRTRKLGIGNMGVHGALIRMNFEYDSPEGRKVATWLQERITNTAIAYSSKLVTEFGRDLPSAWYGSTYEKQGVPLRNLSVTSGQPTGATQLLLSEICGSSGIEPIYSLVTRRNIRGEMVTIINSTFKDIGTQEGWLTDDVIKQIIDNNGSCRGIDAIPIDMRYLFKTALEISWQDHVLMQAAIQRHMTNAISKTINMPSSATVQDVWDAYLMAWQNGCKGCTVYVDGSRDNQVLNTTKTDTKSQQILQRGYVTPAADIAKSVRYKLSTGCGTLYCNVSFDDEGNITETFIESANGGCQVFTKATSRLISLALRGGIPLEKVIDQLVSAGACPAYQFAKGKGEQVSPGKSCASAIANVLKGLSKQHKQLDNVPNVVHDIPNIGPINDNGKCPECGTVLIHESGCVQCPDCGWSRCN